MQEKKGLIPFVQLSESAGWIIRMEDGVDILVKTFLHCACIYCYKRPKALPHESGKRRSFLWFLCKLLHDGRNADGESGSWSIFGDQRNTSVRYGSGHRPCNRAR